MLCCAIAKQTQLCHAVSWHAWWRGRPLPPCVGLGAGSCPLTAAPQEFKRELYQCKVDVESLRHQASLGAMGQGDPPAPLSDFRRRWDRLEEEIVSRQVGRGSGRCRGSAGRGAGLGGCCCPGHGGSGALGAGGGTQAVDRICHRHEARAMAGWVHRVPCGCWVCGAVWVHGGYAGAWGAMWVVGAWCWVDVWSRASTGCTLPCGACGTVDAWGHAGAGRIVRAAIAPTKRVPDSALAGAAPAGGGSAGPGAVPAPAGGAAAVAVPHRRAAAGPDAAAPRPAELRDRAGQAQGEGGSGTGLPARRVPGCPTAALAIGCLL